MKEKDLIYDRRMKEKTLLIQSCSASKKDKPGPAIDVYDGYFYKIIGKALREDSVDENIDIKILSAKYGIIDSDYEISPYDQRMTEERAEELNPEIISQLKGELNSANYDKIVVNVGKDYKKALEGLKDEIDSSIDLRVIEGDGIGQKGSKLKQMITS